MQHSDEVGNYRTSIDNVESSLTDSVVSHALTLVMLLPMMKLAYEKTGHVAVLWHSKGVFDLVRGSKTLETTANSKQSFFIQKWVKLLKIAAQLNYFVSFACSLALLKLVLVAFKLT